MACKFHASMKSPLRSLLASARRRLLLTSLAGLALMAPAWSHAAPAAAEASRRVPLSYEADTGRADLVKKVYTLKGHVRIQQGGLSLESDEAVLRQGEGGHPSVQVTGSAAQPARFEQRPTPPEVETLKGQAQTIDYDDRAGLVRLRGQAQLRRLRGDTVVDEVSGPVITYNRQSGEFQVQGESGNESGGGRVRGVLSGGDRGTP